MAAALTSMFGATPEAATACATMILLSTFLCIAPIGLIWAQFEHINLRKVTVESEHAEEELVAKEEIGAPAEGTAPSPAASQITPR